MLTPEFSWFDVSPDIKQLLILASQTWEDTAQSEKYIHQALALTGDNNIDILVSAYRFFYYKNNYALALQTANKVLNQIRQREQLPDNWTELQPILVKRHAEPQIRLYLNAYAASGLVWAKLGEIEQAKEISTRVKEIDQHNNFGAGILLDVLTRPGEEDVDG